MEEPDPNTGYNFGASRESRKMMAWGGTAAKDPQNGTGKVSRVYDLSTGPKYWTGNYDLTTADLDGDGTMASAASVGARQHDRIPPDV